MRLEGSGQPGKKGWVSGSGRGLVTVLERHVGTVCRIVVELRR